MSELKQVAEAVAELCEMAWSVEYDGSEDWLKRRDSMRALAAGNAATADECEGCGFQTADLVLTEEGFTMCPECRTMEDPAAGDAPEPDECPDCGGAALDFEPCPTCGVEEPRSDSLAEEMERVAGGVGHPDKLKVVSWASRVRALQRECDDAVKRAEAAEARLERAVWFLPEEYTPTNGVGAVNLLNSLRERGYIALASAIEAAEPADATLVTREMWEAAKVLAPTWVWHPNSTIGQKFRAALGIPEEWVQPDEEESDATPDSD